MSNPLFPIIAPDLKDRDYEPYLELAAARLRNASALGELYPQAEAYLAAHLMVLADRGANGGVGPVVNIKTGGIEMGFGVSRGAGRTTSFSAGGYASTNYGLQFLELVHSLGGARLIRG